MLRDIRQLRLRRLRSGGVQEGSAGAVDRARVIAVQVDEVLLVASMLPGRGDKALPAPPDSDHFIPAGRSAVGDRLDYRVEAGDVAAAG